MPVTCTLCYHSIDSNLGSGSINGGRSSEKRFIEILRGTRGKIRTESRTCGEEILMAEEKKEFGKGPELYNREIDWRRALDKTYGVDFKENDDLLDIADGMMKEVDGKDIRNISRATLNYLLSKSRDTYQSIQVLCKTGFGRDALILTRSLFENLIIILYMFKEEEKAEETITEWILCGERTRKIMLNAIEREPTDFFNIKGKWLHKKPEIQKSYKQLPERIRKRQSWIDKGYEQIASKVGLEAEYIYYRSLCDLAHSTSASAKGYVKVEKKRVMTRVGPSKKAIPNALVFSHHYFLMILNKFNSVFDLNQFEDLQKHEQLYSIRRKKLQL